MTSKMISGGLELTRTRGHGNFSYPLRYQGYMNLPMRVKAQTFSFSQGISEKILDRFILTNLTSLLTLGVSRATQS